MAIFKKNGNWYIDYYCDLVRFRQKIGPSKKQAEQMLAIRKAEILQGRFNVNSHKRGIQFKVLAERYLEYSRSNKLSYNRDLSIMKNLVRFFGRCRLNQINPHLIEKYKMQRRWVQDTVRDKLDDAGKAKREGIEKEL